MASQPSKHQFKHHIVDDDDDEDTARGSSDSRQQSSQSKKQDPRTTPSKLPFYNGNRQRSKSGDLPKNKSAEKAHNSTTNWHRMPQSNWRSSPQNQLSEAIRTMHSNHPCAYNKPVTTTSKGGYNHQLAMTGPSTPTHQAIKTLTPTTGRRQSNPAAADCSPRRTKFEEYMPLCMLQQEMKKGEIIEGVLRINPRNYEDAYISAPNGALDIFLPGMQSRNRALHGDRVAVAINSKDQWKLLPDNSTLQKTGKVVAICEENHPRLAGGHLRMMKDKNKNFALFAPKDSRIPRMLIPMNQCPKGFYQHSDQFAQNLFIAKIEEWKAQDNYPRGSLKSFVGNEGDIDAETAVILTENEIDFTEEFPKDVFNDLPLSDDDDAAVWTIPLEEFKTRRDFTQECVFTIDPSSARDLDDALSIRELADGSFEIGVHIADVSYFLREGIKLDEIARHRCNSVYLVQKVIPMLPRILCEKLCSLNAGEDKLTFSVVWIINEEGEVLQQWFGRTIINSCIKLSYELAQKMIDEPDKEWNEDELSPIFGRWTSQDISKRVNLLNKIAMKLRGKRFEEGALRIDKLKLHFTLDQDSRFPVGFTTYSYRDSNRLVEEFMLLANIAVAHQIYNFAGEVTLLRSHKPPDEKAFDDFRKFCEANNFEIDTTSSKSLQQSLETIVGSEPIISKVVSHFLLKSMTRAKYFCTGMRENPSSYHHYALNVPLYTHFTSPIRRYPDVIVHRILSATLKYDKMIIDSIRDLHLLAIKCNKRKMNGRLISEASAKLFLTQYIKNVGSMEDEAVVVAVFDHSIDVLLLKTGQLVRIYMDNLQADFQFKSADRKSHIVLKWKCLPSLTQIIKPCDLLKVLVSINPQDISKLSAIIKPPTDDLPSMNSPTN